MKVEFYRPAPEGSDPDAIAAAAQLVLGTAEWAQGRALVSSEDPELAKALTSVFRLTPVVVEDDSSYRSLGTQGPVVLQPGDLQWFRAAAQIRAPKEAGVTARLVPGVHAGGYDPAAGYRDFDEQIERLDSRTS